ncbi:uncharacterized protein BDV14DRAFT_192149 [Aspergillus stella-maris]|uniref:uncharacterized protein n=1 Tax=Aspergillus stella-maris TaxID=1810926 RepID=UPI003CCCF4A6
MKMHLPRPWPSRASQDRIHAHGSPGSHPVVRRNRSQLPMLHLADTTRNNIIAVAGEFVGTFLFLFFAFAGTQVANTPKPVDGAPPNTDALLYSALSFGFSLVVNIWAFYRITGGLFNPAVTLALVLVGGMPWMRGLFVFAAQIVGGIASAGVVSALFPGDLNVTTRLGGGASIAQGLFIEMFLTAQLVFVIIMLAVVKHKSTFLAPVAIGLTFFVTEMIGDYYTGGSLNPSRSLGPDVINRSFPGYHWIYWVGPLLGSLLACGFYYFLTLASYESVNPGQDFNDWEAKMGSSWDGSVLQGRYSDTTTLGRAVSPRGSTAVNGNGVPVQMGQGQGHDFGARATDTAMADPSRTAEGNNTNGSLSGSSDAALLAKMGYKQELRRQYSTLQIFAIAFSIMGLVPSIASTIAFSLPAGPAGMVWGWLTASILIFFVGLAMADMASAMPTAGGLYWWTHYFAGAKWKNPLSFLVGYSNTLGLIGGICSVDYTLSLLILACISIARDGEWSASLILIHAAATILTSRIMPRIQTACIFINVALILATVIALPVGKVSRGGTLNSGTWVFSHVDNLSNWPVGWNFVLSFMSPIWAIGFFDSCVHMSEEAVDAGRAVPRGILFSAGSACVLGFLVLAVLAAVMDPVVGNTVGTVFGQPMAQIYYDSLGKHGALGFMAVLILIQFLIGLSLIVAASRQTFAFARDHALPFSPLLRRITPLFNNPTPINAILFLAGICIIFGLLVLINSVAANALFSLFVASNYVAWGVPILCRLVWKSRFVPGVFFTGKWSEGIAIVAVSWLAFGLVLSMFPTVKNPGPDEMNYTVVINGFVWIACMAYYYIYARKVFSGPRSTLNGAEAGAGISANRAGDDESIATGTPTRSEASEKVE